MKPLAAVVSVDATTPARVEICKVKLSSWRPFFFCHCAELRFGTSSSSFSSPGPLRPCYRSYSAAMSSRSVGRAKCFHCFGEAWCARFARVVAFDRAALEEEVAGPE